MVVKAPNSQGFERILRSLFSWGAKNFSNEFGTHLTKEEQNDALNEVFDYVYVSGYELSSAAISDVLNATGSKFRIDEDRAKIGVDKYKRKNGLTGIDMEELSILASDHNVKYSDIKDPKISGALGYYEDYDLGWEGKVAGWQRDLRELNVYVKAKGNLSKAYQKIEGLVGIITADRVRDLITLMAQEYGDYNPNIYKVQKLANGIVNATIAIEAGKNILELVTAFSATTGNLGDWKQVKTGILRNPRNWVVNKTEGVRKGTAGLAKEVKGIGEKAGKGLDYIDMGMEAIPFYMPLLAWAITEAAKGAAYRRRISASADLSYNGVNALKYESKNYSRNMYRR